MKIKNQVSKSTLENIYCIACYVVGTLTIGVLSWLGDISMKFSSIAMIIISFGLGVYLIQEMRKRKNDIAIANKKTLQIDYINFQKEGISIVYKNPKFTKNILYSNLDELKLTINTKRAGYKPQTLIYSININITDNNQNKYDIFFAPVNINKMYKMVCYSKFIKNFEYSFTGNGWDARQEIANNFERIKRNKYKLSLSMIAKESLLWFVLLLALCVLCIPIYMLKFT